MKPLTMQPTFVIELAVPADIATAKLRDAITSEELRDHAQSAGSCLDFLVEPEQQRFWSPHLSVQVSETSDEHSELYCRFSPRPEIWTMFMAIYAVIIALIFISTIYAYVQWFMGDRPWSLAMVPLGIIIIAGLHSASLIGQRLSSDQMQMLRDRLAKAIELAFGTGHELEMR
jgi:uncharacterized integral membrane protein